MQRLFKILERCGADYYLCQPRSEGGGQKVSRPQAVFPFLPFHLLAPKASIKVEPNVEIMFCTETSMTQPIDKVGYGE